MSSALILGSDAHLPRQIRLPARRIETDVSFIDTSRLIYSSMAVLHSMLGPGVQSRARISILSGNSHRLPSIVGWDCFRGDSLPRLPHVDGAHSAASKCHRVVA